jgi:glucosylceramidase
MTTSIRQLPITALFISAALLCMGYSCNKQEDPSDNDSVRIETWITRADRTMILKNLDLDLEFDTITNGYSTITVDTSRMYQEVKGFGFTLTGGSAWLINQLPADKKEAIVHELFSADSGCIGISYLRISIGSSDLDAATFSYNDLPAGETDPNLERFSLDKDRTDLIPILKMALKENPDLSILGSPWSAPVWMKSNRSTVGGKLLPQYYDVYARYFVKYIQGMAAEGIRIDGITIQNEPLNPNNNPSMEMSATEQAAFIKNNLGPAFRTAGIDTKIILYDHNCDRPDYPITILNDPEAKQYVDGSAFHLYGGEISAMTTVKEAHPDKNLYFTEQWVGGPSNFGPDLRWHVKNLIIGAMRNWSQTVLEWNLASDPSYRPHTPGGCTQCEGALTIGTLVSRNVSYYIIAHASKFVPAGSVRIESNLPDGLPNVAFQTPAGRKVLIVLNDSDVDRSFNIGWKGKLASTRIAGGSVTTYLW